MFLPTTKEELQKLNWDSLDVIIVTGDVYVDSPYFGSAIIGKVLLNAGYKVGIIAQPDIKSNIDIGRLGEPKLFWGVTSGCVDSMVSNYTPTFKKRRDDDLTPGLVNDKRPNRAVIAYTNLIRKYFKNTVPVILGGIEASLRRIAHYDYWENKVRRSILFDAKADYIIYGMAEKAILEAAESLKNKSSLMEIKGLCYISKEKKDDFLELPPFENATQDKNKFEEMFKIFYQNNDPVNSKGLVQKHGERYLIHNPPADFISTEELDKIYNLEFEREVHPFYKKMGEVRAMETIKYSITSHRGCFGSCSFCAISMHQGKKIISRSEESILKEAEEFTRDKNFKGIIYDVGGPTANMYGMECSTGEDCGSIDCLSGCCINLNASHKRQIDLLERIMKITGVKKVFITSGIRYDLIMNDKEFGKKYLEELVKHHISGQLKIAPEHSEMKILELMNKPMINKLTEFIKKFYEMNKKFGKKNFLTYYFIAAHPGSENEDMHKLKSFIRNELKTNPEQVQIFTPTPSTYSTLMYYTEKDYKKGKKIFVEKEIAGKIRQKNSIIKK